jgi:DNA-binding PadR family transcriptional regulator
MPKLDPINTTVLLGLLEEAPRHGYQLRQILDEQLAEFLQISTGSLYYALRKLELRGWVKSSLSRPGRRPERRVFRITPAGRAEFLRLLEATAFAHDALCCPFDVALYFIRHLPPQTVLRALDRKMQVLRSQIERLHGFESRYPGRWPFHLYYLREKAKESAAATERWCQRLRKKIVEKEKSWSTFVSAKNRA